MKKHVGITTSIVVSLAALFFTATAAFAQLPPDNQPDITIDAQAKAKTISKLVQELKGNYAFPDVGDNLAKMLEEHQAHGDYNSIASAKKFAETLTQQMADIAHDPHLRILYQAQAGGPPEPLPLEAHEKNANNYDVPEAKRLDGNIGYLKILGFPGHPDHFGSLVGAALALLADTDALIIDLRQSRGGHPDTVTCLASFFFRDPTHLNDFKLRKPGTQDYEITQFWTNGYAPGQRYLNKEVYILTSHADFSAAEGFPYDLQTQKRATIVGEVTRGGANPGGPVPIGEHFSVFLPIGYSVNPITHTNWEDVGVKPDIEVPAADALKMAEKTALEHLIAKSTKQQEQDALKHDLEKLETDPELQKPQ